MINKLIPLLDKVKSRGRNKWVACCPAHDDSDPSLAIAEVDGRLLVKCFAGCDPAAIVGAVGLSLSDLFEESSPDHYRPLAFAQKERRESESKKTTIARERLVIALAESDRRAGKKQSKKDRDRELQAVKYLIENNIEYSPDAVLMDFEVNGILEAMG